MAHHVLGHEAFKRGLQNYMKKHQYSNTETFDLWGAWAEASGKPVKEIMCSWTEQMGYPLVEVTKFSLEGATAKLSLKQSWFLSSGEAPPDDRTWTIPLFVRTSGQEEVPVVMMTAATMDLEVPVAHCTTASAFVLLNAGAATPLRVSYTPEMRLLLTDAIVAGSIPPADRASLVQSSYALAKAGKLGVDEVLMFLVAFYAEAEYTVWSGLETVFNGLDRLIMGGCSKEMYERFGLFAENFVWRAWETLKLGWEAQPTDGHTTGLLRGLLMKLVSKFAARPTWLSEARRRFKLWVEDPIANAGELPDEYRVPVLRAVLARGGEEEHSSLLGVFEKLTKDVDRKHVYHSLGFAAQPELKTKTLQWAITGKIKIQDFFYPMGSVSSSSRQGLDMMWAFLNAHFDDIHAMVAKASPSLMDAVIMNSTSGYCSEEKAVEIDAFFTAHPLPQNKRTISRALERIRADSLFLQRMLARARLSNQQFWDLLHGATKASDPATTMKKAGRAMSL